MDTATTRSRTFSWDDPAIGAQIARQMDGLDYLQAMSNGTLPVSPLVQTLGFSLTNIEKGFITFRFVPQEFHYNPIGSVHGGVISSILDSAMGCCIHSLLIEGSIYTTLELKVNFLKAVTIHSGPMRAVAKAIHTGRSTALLEATLIDEWDTVHAFGTSTCMILNTPQDA